MPRVVRKQKPPALTDYRKFKPYLRLDFDRRCAYCHIPEDRYGSAGNFAVDHFRPKSRREFRRLVCVYSNLFYACRDCNLYKAAHWPDEEDRRLGRHLLNPCRVDLSKHWNVAEAGNLVPVSREAEYMIQRMKLNRSELLKFRKRKADQLLRIRRLEIILSEVTGGTFSKREGLNLLATWKRELADEFGDYWTA